MAKVYSEDEFEIQFDKLPETLQEALYSADVASRMFEVGEKYGLAGERMRNASMEAGNIVLGLTQPKEFIARLSEILNIKPDAATTLAKDIYQNVLKPFQDEIKHTHGFDLSESAFDAKPPLVAPQAEPQKPPALVIPPRPVVQQTQPAPRPAPPPPQPPRVLEPTIPSTPPSPAPPKPVDIPRQAPPAPPAPPPPLPSEQMKPLPPTIVNVPLAPTPFRPLPPRPAPIAPPPAPKPPTLPEPRAQRNIFSPKIPGPLEPQREPARPAQEKPTPPLQPRVFTPLQPKPPSIPGGEENGIPKVKESPKPLGRAVTGFAPRRPGFPPQDADPYRETVMPQEKELQQKRDTVSDPRGPQPHYQVRKGEPPYVNPKIPPIDLRDDAPRPPAPPDPHWEKLQ